MTHLQLNSNASFESIPVSTHGKERVRATPATPWFTSPESDFDVVPHHNVWFNNTYIGDLYITTREGIVLELRNDSLCALAVQTETGEFHGLNDFEKGQCRYIGLFVADDNDPKRMVLLGSAA